MKAADLDRLIIWQRPFISAPNEYGVPTQANGSPQVIIRAQLVERQQEEAPHETGGFAKSMLTFRLRYVPGIKPGDWLSFETGSYEVASVKELGRRAWLELTAIERR